MADIDAVFRALTDPTDAGCSTRCSAGRADAERTEARLQMTRFGVMTHLRVLEEAGLVHAQARAREVAPSESRPDQARPRPPLGQQVRRALGRRAHGHQTRARGANHGGRRRPAPHPAQPRSRGQGSHGGVRDLHRGQGRPAPVGGDRRSRSCGRSTASAWRPTHSGAPARATRPALPVSSTSRPARTWRSTHRSSNCRPSTPSGAMTSGPRGPRGSPGRSSPSATSCS